jgi:hypothetical protein
MIAASRTDCLLSMPADTPSQTFSDVAIEYERREETLWLDPFLLFNGELEWATPPDELDNDELDDRP